MGIIGIGVAIAAAGLYVAVKRQPDEFRIARSAKLAAPIDVLFGHVNDFRRWSAWSPWEKLDPKLERTYSGAAEGVGAVYEWSGNNKAGAGKMTIKQSVPSERIEIELVFSRPMAATNTAEFTFERGDGGVTVTWSMSGRNTLGGKLFALVVNMDKMLGKSFEEGLEKLGRVAAAPAEAQLTQNA
jgi:hypothetical protein